MPDGITSVKPCISVKDNGVTCAVHLTYASFVKLDEYTQSQLTTLSGKITATSDRLSSVYTKSETDAKLKTKVEQSALTQTSNALSASIAKNSKILSSIGLTSDTAYINANRIALNGKTLMSNATINDALIGNLSANKITTGTLNASKVNLINVNASNISTGVLSGIKITSTGKDPSGTSSTTTIKADISIPTLSTALTISWSARRTLTHARGGKQNRHHRACGFRRLPKSRGTLVMRFRIGKLNGKDSWVAMVGTTVIRQSLVPAILEFSWHSLPSRNGATRMAVT